MHDLRDPQGVVAGKPERFYESTAEDVLRMGQAGSSAGGEQPKFLVRRGADGVALIVKFSPPVGETIGRRVADLLIAEHLALETLADAGHAAARTHIVIGKTRVFLEIERFDRLANGGRRGVFSLATLDDEFIGRAYDDWSALTKALVVDRIVTREDLTVVDRQRVFGLLTANTDMHRQNLSFFHSGTTLEGPTPAYDMQPMHFAPMHAAQLRPRRKRSVPARKRAQTGRPPGTCRES